MEIDAKAALNFWFNDTTHSQWFNKEPALDAMVRQRFQGLTRQAIAGELSPWSESPQHGLALLLLLDQFPRQLWRDTAMAFAGDPQALALSLQALQLGWIAAELVFKHPSQHQDLLATTMAVPFLAARRPTNGCNAYKPLASAIYYEKMPGALWICRRSIRRICFCSFYGVLPAS